MRVSAEPAWYRVARQRLSAIQNQSPERPNQVGQSPGSCEDTRGGEARYRTKSPPNDYAYSPAIFRRR